MSDRWLGPDPAPRGRQGQYCPGEPQSRPTYVICPRWDSTACGQCESMVVECGYGRHCRLCNAGLDPQP